MAFREQQEQSPSQTAFEQRYLTVISTVAERGYGIAHAHFEKVREALALIDNVEVSANFDPIPFAQSHLHADSNIVLLPLYGIYFAADKMGEDTADSYNPDRSEQAIRTALLQAGVKEQDVDRIFREETPTLSQPDDATDLVLGSGSLLRAERNGGLARRFAQPIEQSVQTQPPREPRHRLSSLADLADIAKLMEMGREAELSEPPTPSMLPDDTSLSYDDLGGHFDEYPEPNPLPPGLERLGPTQEPSTTNAAEKEQKYSVLPHIANLLKVAESDPTILKGLPSDMLDFLQDAIGYIGQHGFGVKLNDVQKRVLDVVDKLIGEGLSYEEVGNALGFKDVHYYVQLAPGLLRGALSPDLQKKYKNVRISDPRKKKWRPTA